MKISQQEKYKIKKNRKGKRLIRGKKSNKIKMKTEKIKSNGKKTDFFLEKFKNNL